MALAIVVDRARPPEVRRVAALIVGLLLRETAWTERCATQASIALADAVDCAPAALVLARLLFRCAPDRARAAGAVARVAARAYSEGYQATALLLVLRLLRHEDGVGLVTPALANSVFAWARDCGDTRRAAAVVDAWVERHGAGGPWVRDAVETTPSLLANDRISIARRRELHAAAPTVAGWQVFASSVECATLLWSPTLFGREIEPARQTLEQAIGEELEGRRRMTLACWLVEIS